MIPPQWLHISFRSRAGTELISMSQMSRDSRGGNTQRVPAFFIRLVTNQYFFTLFARRYFAFAYIQDNDMCDDDLSIFGRTYDHQNDLVNAECLFAALIVLNLHILA